MEEEQKFGGNEGGEEHNLEQQPLEGLTEPGPKKPSSTVVIAAVIIVIAIILANAIRSSEETKTDTTEHTEVETSQDTNTPKNTNGDSATSTLLIKPGDFEDRDKAEAIINRTQGKTIGNLDTERIIHGIVQDETEKDVYYFATTNLNSESNFVGIYKYNTISGRWHRLYKDTFAPEKGQSTILRVAGKEGNNLIIARDFMNNSPGPCDSLLLNGEKDNFGLFTLDITKPLEGMKQYELPGSVRSAELKKVTSCQDNF